ncbi:uncharacterized protein LOC119308161 isoform X2 [Triticum dicoccoides]|uniref:uncharacterized protein LOC119308161 isoform X2 n=1 Tax=Triticum dicoccoides TaxID=85692 RepID=UPI00188E4545|nr:uncharacterized protein LOC119308161 isoform X2 [Triticum dicoccoides]
MPPGGSRRPWRHTPVEVLRMLRSPQPLPHPRSSPPLPATPLHHRCCLWVGSGVGGSELELEAEMGKVKKGDRMEVLEAEEAGDAWGNAPVVMWWSCAGGGGGWRQGTGPGRRQDINFLSWEAFITFQQRLRMWSAVEGGSPTRAAGARSSRRFRGAEKNGRQSSVRAGLQELTMVMVCLYYIVCQRPIQKIWFLIIYSLPCWASL